MREGSSRRGRKRRTWNEVLPEEEENNHKSDSDQRRSSTWRHPSASCSAHSGLTPTSFWLHSDLLPSLQHLWSLNPSSFLSPCKSSGPALLFFFRMAGSTGSDLTRHPCGCMCVRRSRSRTNPTLTNDVRCWGWHRPRFSDLQAGGQFRKVCIISKTFLESSSFPKKTKVAFLKSCWNFLALSFGVTLFAVWAAALNKNLKVLHYFNHFL